MHTRVARYSEGSGKRLQVQRVMSIIFAEFQLECFMPQDIRAPLSLMGCSHRVQIPCSNASSG